MDDIVTGVESTETVEGEAEINEGNAHTRDLDDDEDDFLPPESRKKNPLQCDLCSKILGSRQALKAHAITHVDPASRQTFRCEICEATFKSQLGLRYHQETKHISGSKRKKLPCPTCGRIFKSAEGRKIHMTIQHGADGPIFKCQECPMIFARKPHLDLHMTTHGFGLHVCTICGKPYARLKDLSRHEATCGVKELCCPVCGKQFRKKQALRNHKKKCRPNSRNIPCLTCGQKFETEQALKTHQAVHRKTFRCGECTQTFGTVLALRQHEQTRHRKRLDFGHRNKNDNVTTEGTKVRMRRSKYDLYIGLEHLADPATLIEEDKPDNRVDMKPKDPRRFACELCPGRYKSKRSLVNHKQSQHWEALGLQEPSYKTPHPLEGVNYEELPEVIEAGKEEGELKMYDATSEQVAEKVVMISNFVDPEGLLEELNSSDVRCSDNTIVSELTLGTVDNTTNCGETFNVEKITVPNEEIIIVEIIKQESIEFEEGGFDTLEYYSTGSEEPVELPFENDAADSETPEEQTTDEVDTLAVEPKLETGVLSEPPFSKELVIMLEKLDYSELVKPPVKKILPFKSKYKNPLPRIECEHCGQTFAIRYRLAMHRIKEHGSTEIAVPNSYRKPMLPLNFHCDQCNKSYHLETNLSIHKEKVHQNGKTRTKGIKNVTKRTCRRCKKQFTSFKSLVYHLKFVHGETVDESRHIRCPTCCMKYLTTEEMAEHVCFKETPVVKEKERPFKCDALNCDKSYFVNHRLEEHYSVHPEYQHFKCDQCSKGFFRERQLSKHKKEYHKSLEMYLSCEICDQLLKNHNSWKNHMETHSVHKLYCCEHCGKKFKVRKNLRTHKYHMHSAAMT